MTCSLTPSDSLIHLMTGDAASAADAAITKDLMGDKVKKERK